MKVLLVHENVTYGGADKQIAWLSNLLCNYAEVHFFTFRNNSNEQVFLPNVKMINANTEKKGHNIKSLLSTAKMLRRLIRKEKYSHCIAYSSPSQLRLLIATIGLRTQVVVSQRGDPYNSNSSGLVHSLTSFLFKFADKYIFQTTYAQNYYPAKIRKKSVVIPNAVTPLERTKDRKNGVEKKIVNLARYDIRQKRQDILIEAFKRVYKKYPQYTLELYGDGPDKSIIEEKIANHANIAVCGKTTKPVLAIQNASIFVLCSDFEGIPNALLEAMSLGVPCICTDYSPGGVSLIINNYNNGIIVPKGDVNSLANAIEYCIENNGLAEEFGIKAKETMIKNYSNEIIGKEWLKALSINGK